jgi:hypothetical protein
VNRISRILLFSALPAVRRFFYYDLLLYGILSLAPLILLVNWTLTIRRVCIASLLLAICAGYAAYWEPMRYLKYLPLIFFIMVYSTANIEKLDTIKHAYFVLFFLAASCLSVYQNYFGFFSWDIAFLQSGVGSIGEEGYLSHRDIRPMSFFSGIAEATLFYVFAMVIFALRRKYFLCFLALILVLMSGSRGILVSFILGSFVSSRKNISDDGVILRSFLVGVMAYLAIVILAPLLSILQGEFEANRLAFYGSMGARIHYLTEFFESFSLVNIVSPVMLDQQIYDNILLTMINDFGLVPASLLLFCIYKSLYVSGYWGNTFMSTFIIYGFFADQVSSIYFLAIFWAGTTMVRHYSLVNRKI